MTQTMGLGAFNEAMEYIEQHLFGDLDMEKVARCGGCTPHTFLTIFAYVAGFSLSDYIRKRRLSQAAVLLRAKNARVLEVALRCGYESPTAFTRAFTALHGITPREAMRTGAKVISFPPVSFQLIIKGADKMEYRIEDKKAMQIIGKHWTVSMKDGENFKRIPMLWKEEMANGNWKTYERFGGDVVGACADVTGDALTYWIGKISDDKAPEDMQVLSIPAAQYAVFPCTMETIQTVTRQIYAQWLPSSGYELSKTPDIEWYGMDDNVEIWIPVVKQG